MKTKKFYNVKRNVGKSKFVVSYGTKKGKFNIAKFNNDRAVNLFIGDLVIDGYEYSHN